LAHIGMTWRTPIVAATVRGTALALPEQ